MLLFSPRFLGPYQGQNTLWPWNRQPRSASPLRRGQRLRTENGSIWRLLAGWGEHAIWAVCIGRSEFAGRFHCACRSGFWRKISRSAFAGLVGVTAPVRTADGEW